MPDERLVQEIEKILSDVVALGGQRERTSIVPNMLVRDASPAGQDDYVIIADNRDNDNILALRVPGVVYADNDLVNVIFPEGGEAIAFQQGSGSTTSGLWDIVAGTNDIYYDKGDVGIGKSVAPDAALEILDTSQQQLRLTFQEDTKFANFTVDTNHDLTIKTSSVGGFRFQPTTDQTDSFQILDADGGTPVVNVDLINERVGIGTATPDSSLVVDNNAWIGGAAVSGNTVQNSSYMEEGLVINSGAAKEMIALKDPAVAHGMTTNAETDTFGSLLVSTGFLGGLSIIGYSEDQLANTVIGRAASGSTFKGTSSLAPVTLNAQKKSGTTVTAMGADENLVTISNGLVSPQTKWILDADGDSWQQGSITLGTDVIHEGDTDTKISFTTDDVEIFAGNLSMLKLTETTQDVVRLGPGSGDVDINFNGDMFLLGSNGFLGLNNVTPANPIHIINGVPGREGPQVRVGATSSGYFGLYSTADNIGGTIAGASLDDTGFIARTTTPCFFTQVGTDGTIRLFSDSGKTAGVGFTATERMRIKYDGVAIGTTTTNLAQLYVSQSSGIATIPPLLLNQSNVSEDMMQFSTTIGTGNAIEAVGAKTLTTTHFIKVTLPGGLIRYFEVGTIA